ncbi:MAG: hypothetical protein Q9195_008629 [Heterodermia aff. obscurata]
MKSQDGKPPGSYLYGRDTMDIDIIEEEDISNAIAISLDTPQLMARHVHSADWMPAKERTRVRQNEALKEATINKDFPHLSSAIRESLEDAKIVQTAGGPQATGASTEDKQRTQTPNNFEPLANRSLGPSRAISAANRITSLESLEASKPPRSIQESIVDMTSELALWVPPVNDPDGDTYVYIDPPPKQPEQDGTSYSIYRSQAELPMVMKSLTLLSLNSSIISKAMGPTEQHRVLRRRGLVGRLPSHIKYVIDLTPATEGDGAAHLLSELYCPDGVRKWFIAAKLWSISTNLIGGQDECTVKVVNSDHPSESLDDSLQEVSDADEKAQRSLKHEEESMELPLEYSPIRHRSGIVRVLHIISGNHPNLDTAVKVWSACVIAASLEISSPEFLDYIFSWVYNGKNSYILEVLPEVSLRMAHMMKSYNMCRDAFAVLVGEEALESLIRDRLGTSPKTILGRNKEDLKSESYLTRLQYASKAFIERVTAEFERIVRMDWLDNVDEFKKLSLTFPTNPTTKNLDTYEEARDVLSITLKRYIRGGVYRLLCVDWHLDLGKLRYWDYSRTNPLFPRKDFREVWNLLKPRERMLTRSFWHLLADRPVSSGPTNLSTASASKNFIPVDQPSSAEQHMRSNWVFEEVKCDQLTALSTELEFLRTLSPGSVADPQHLSHTTEEPSNDDPKAFDLGQLFQEAEDYLVAAAKRMLSNTDKTLHSIEVLDTLNCLTESEWKYLPLWAGGCDDGSGGVYDEDIPMASSSFSHPGPNVHIGPDSTAGSSEFDFIRGPATHNTSTATNDNSDTRASTDINSMFGAIAIDSPAGASAQKTTARQGHSEFGDSEYDFASATSVNEGPQHASASNEAGTQQSLSVKAQGKQPLRDGGDKETVDAYIRRIEREQEQRRVASEDAEFTASFWDEEENAEMEDDNEAEDGSLSEDDNDGGVTVIGDGEATD